MAKNANTKNTSTNCGYEDSFGQNKSGTDASKTSAQNKTSNKTSGKASNKATDKATDKTSGTDSYEC